MRSTFIASIVLSVTVLFSATKTHAQPQFNCSNGHYYELVVSTTPIDWTSAKDSASNRFFVDSCGRNMRGYLATITSRNEQQFLNSVFGHQRYVWVGGREDISNNEWRWVTGPEGLCNGGLGMLIWRGGPASAGGVACSFENWIPPSESFSGEPNNFGGNEDFLNWNHDANAPGVDGRIGLWNDLPHGDQRVFAYLVEYSATTSCCVCCSCCCHHPTKYCRRIFRRAR